MEMQVMSKCECHKTLEGLQNWRLSCWKKGEIARGHCGRRVLVLPSLTSLFWSIHSRVGHETLHGSPSQHLFGIHQLNHHREVIRLERLAEQSSIRNDFNPLACQTKIWLAFDWGSIGTKLWYNYTVLSCFYHVYPSAKCPTIDDDSWLRNKILAVKKR